MASSSYCYRLVEKYCQVLDEYKESMKQDLANMNWENASSIKEMESTVDEIAKLCDSLKSTINSYHFE